LHLIVVSLTVGEDLADVVDQTLLLVDVPGFLPFHHQCRADDLGDCCHIQEEGLTELW
jgi:hypothetical protein